MRYFGSTSPCGDRRCSLFVFPAVILAGFLYPVEMMPAFFRWLSPLDPVRHILVIVRAVFLKGQGIVDLWREYAIPLAMAAAALALSVARFRRAVT
ncbi:MAG TPA: ABC transporter permease [Gemmatimonadota bacterium]|nr:ABC transporter permease [Gemmatimonadota bacterium]